jgi:hypothetical protein
MAAMAMAKANFADPHVKQAKHHEQRKSWEEPDLLSTPVKWLMSIYQMA